MKLSDVATFVEEKVSSEDISLLQYVTTDSLLQNKAGRTVAQNLPPQKCSLTSFKKGDVLLGNIRPYLKKIWYANIDGGCSQDVLVLRAKENKNSSFLYALLSQDSFFEYEMKATKGSKMPRGDKNHIMNFPCLDLKNKIGIGNFFSLLDKKIALNSRIKARLEQMAKRLYDYWFVQFDFPRSVSGEPGLHELSRTDDGKPRSDFPDENGKPYKSSGGKMVYNAELKREIPAGWEVKNLEDVLDNAGVATTFGEHLKNLDYCPIDEIPMRTMSFAGGKSYKEANSSLQLYEKKDILIGAMRVYFHRCCIASKKGITRTTTIVLRPRQKEHLNYLYQVCNEENTFDFAIKVSSGTQQPYVTWNALSKYQFAYPNNTILIKEFCDKIDNITDRILINVREIEKLIALRDELLPLLMNGQVTVS